MAEGKASMSATDLIGILLEDGSYKDNIEEIIDDIIILFIAGSKTIQATTTNFITHLLEDKELCDKFHAEIDPILDPIKDQIQEKLTTEIVEDFEYLKLVYFEVLRYNTPFPMGSAAVFTKDITIGGVKFTPHDAFTIDMQ